MPGQLAKPRGGCRLNPHDSLAKSLAGAWLFNEGGGLRANDATRIGSTGVFTGGAAWRTGSYGPESLYTADGQYVDCGSTGAWASAQSAITVSCICVTDTVTDSPAFNGYRYVVNTENVNTGDLQFVLRILPSVGQFEWQVYDGTYRTTTVSVGLAIGRVYRVLGTYNLTSGGALYVWDSVGGYYTGSFVAGSSLLHAAPVTLKVGGNSQGTNRQWNGSVTYASYSTRYTTANEANVWSNDPFRMFRPTRRLLPIAGGNVYSISVGSTSYALFGSAVGLRKNYSLPVGSGSYSQSGTVVALTHGRPMAVGSGSYIETGSAVGLERGHKIPIGQGSYSLNGSAVGLERGYPLAVESGTFTLNGTDVALTYSGSIAKVISVGSGTFSLTGSAIALRATHRLPIGSGTFSETGLAVSLEYSRKLPVGSGSYSLIGTSVSLRFSHKLPVGSGSFVETGSVVVLRRNYPLQVGPGIFAETGSPVAFLVRKFLPIGSGIFIWTGTNVTLTYQSVVKPVGVPIMGDIGLSLTVNGSIGLSLSINGQGGLS